MSVAIETNEHGQVYRSAGYSDRLACKEMSPHALFQIGSQTKMFTAACIIKLAKSGLLSLDDEASKYLPEVEELSGGAPFSIRQLLTHTSGIGDFTTFMEGLPPASSLAWPYLSYSYEELVFLAKVHGKQSDPGKYFAYNNAGYVLLGQIVEVVSQRPFYRFVQEHLLEPLGMVDTFCGSFGDWPRDRAAQGFHCPAAGYNGPPISTNDMKDLSWASSAGDMISCLDDMLKWISALCISDNAINLNLDDFIATKVQCGSMGDCAGNVPKWLLPDIWALGIENPTFSGHSLWGHRGGTFGFSSATFIEPVSGMRMAAFMSFEHDVNKVFHRERPIYWVQFLTAVVQIGMCLTKDNRAGAARGSF